MACKTTNDADLAAMARRYRDRLERKRVADGQLELMKQLQQAEADGLVRAGDELAVAILDGRAHAAAAIGDHVYEARARNGLPPALAVVPCRRVAGH